MGNIIEEIERIEDAKSAINGAIIQSGGPAGEEDDLIDTYAERVRAIPSAVLSNLNVSISGGTGSYIESIKQENGKIVTTTGGTVSTSKSGLAPKIVTTNAATIATSELVLTSNGSTTVWKKLPANAFANNKVTLTAKSDNVAYPILIGPTSGGTSGVYYDTGVTLNPSTNTIAANITGSASYLTTTLNTITAPTDDTITNWGAKGNSVHMYSILDQLNNQPSQFGLLLNLAYGKDVHQIWATQSNGNLYHRGGNQAGWANSGSWITILDSANSSVSGDGGNTWGSSITIKINNVSKTLTIPANPNTDEKVAYTANTSNVAHPILFANNSTDTGTPTTGAVYYETNSTNSPGLTYNPYSNTLNTSILNIYNGGHIQINAAIEDHNNPMDQCLCIATPTTNSNLTIKNSPGIGFKVEGKSWASMIFNHAGPCFEFINSNATANVNIKAAQLISSIGTGYSPLRVTSTTLVSNLNADMLDNYHADDFYKKDDPIDADTLNGFKVSDFTRIATININHSGSTGILNIYGTGIVGGSISVDLGQQISLPTRTINIDGTIQETLLMTLPPGITATISTSSIVISINRNNLSNGGTGQIKLLVY